MYYYIKFKICQTMIKLNRLFIRLIFVRPPIGTKSNPRNEHFRPNKPGAPIQLTMYGLFFEDIN